MGKKVVELFVVKIGKPVTEVYSPDKGEIMTVENHTLHVQYPYIGVSDDKLRIDDCVMIAVQRGNFWYVIVKLPVAEAEKLAHKILEAVKEAKKVKSIEELAVEIAKEYGEPVEK